MLDYKFIFVREDFNFQLKILFFKFITLMKNNFNKFRA